jgi:hypothetical protein
MPGKIVVLFIVIGVLAAACASTASDPAPAQPPSPASEKNDGSSFETAVVIMEETEDKGVAAEYAWLKQRYPGYRMKRQSLATHDGKPFDIITIITASGEETSVYFDISRFFGKW